MRNLRLGKILLSKMPRTALWDFGSVNHVIAMRAILNTKDAVVFESRGQELAERIRKIVKPDSVVLDFGCGIGRPEKYLAPFCRQLYGVDFSRGMLRLARRRHNGLKNVFFCKNNGSDLSIFEDGKFDLIFSEAVFQHIEKETTVVLLMEIYRVLKQQGEALLQFCNIECPQNMEIFLKGVKNRPYTPGRMRYWLPEEVEILLKAIGFKIISLTIENDARDVKGMPMFDDYHRGYSIWVHVMKSAERNCK